MLFDPAPKIAAADQAGLVVIRTVVSRSGMRNVDGDHGDMGFPILCGYDGSHFFIGLKLDREIDLFTHEQVGATLRDLGAITVVDTNQFDSLGHCSSLQTLRALPRELIIGALRRVAQA